MTILCWMLVSGGWCQAGTESRDVAPTAAEQFKRLTFEELLNQEVSTVSRREEPLSTSASAVQVVTQEEIRRSGASSIPEALRLFPNLHVAQVDSRNWAISARGFNNALANKLLVMIDGRTVYTPLFAGVFWDAQHVLLEDVERIEVVSGPGATLWGANAVNGVINIITRNARDTQGLLVQGGGGSFLRDFGAIRYGGSAGSNMFFRVYGRRFDRESTVFANGQDGGNAWDLTQGGFRMDWIPQEASAVTVQGDAYAGNLEQPQPGHTTIDGQNLLGRWTHSFSRASELSAQIYFDRTWRRVPNQFAEDLRTVDLDLQHWFDWRRHRVTWGAGYRFMHDDVRNSPALAFLPATRHLELFSGFVQDEFMLMPDTLRLTVGSKFEHNDYTGIEYEPSGRIAWTPAERHTVWSAVSRAVRIPSRIDRDFFLPQPPVPPGTTNLAGGRDFESEKLVALEAGYRVRPITNLTLSLAAFYNIYDDIRSVEPVGLETFEVRNRNRAESWGLELAGQAQPAPWWRLRGGYTFLRKNVSPKTGGRDMSGGRAEGNSPEHQVGVQSMWDLPADLEFDVSGRYVAALAAPRVPEYFTFDARLAWRVRKNVELSVVGQNLWDRRHPEFGEVGARQEIPRSVYGKITLWF
ncbi:MAG TPA: TonB-dependent receptor [Verrucomicrobia bacterium]|nr:TonB-dependent receptor [Verrucomicrobiota bacterium]HOP97009.1 TonB-dependent receptor [Verrucomicrobiota bacterium]